MMRWMCRSKIHRATVTDANLNYEGSVTIDATLLAAAGMLPYERVQVVNLNNGSRVETYCMAGEANRGTICMNGAAARWAAPGDRVIIISYAAMEDAEARAHRPTIVHVNERNQITETRREEISHAHR